MGLGQNPDMSELAVLAFAGSLRARSFNRALIAASQELAPQGLQVVPFDLSVIPVYNMDLEPDFPAPVVAFKEAIKSADGLLIATPEHNFSFSGVLKNAIDWASRPASDGVFSEKPVILQSASPGWTGGLRSQIQLRSTLNYFPMRQMYFPEVVVGRAHEKFDSDLKLTDPMAIEQITKQLAAFRDFILANR